MKSFQKTGLFAVFVIGLALVSYFFVYQGAQRDEERKQKASALMPMEIDQVESVQIQKGAQSTTVSRVNDSWRLTQPVDYNADRSEAESFLAGVLGEKSLQVVREGSGINWGVYGLDKPEGSVTFKLKDGSRKSVVIGSRRTYDNDLYLRFDNEDKVHLVSSSWSGYLLRDAKTFRDKVLFGFKPEDVLEVKLNLIEEGKPSNVHIQQKEKGVWVFAEASLDLSQEAVFKWFESIQDLRAMDFPAEDKAKYKANGTKVLEGDFVVTGTDGKSKTTINFKVFEQSDGYEVIVSDKMPVFKIGKLAGDKLKYDQGDFRDKKKPFAFKLGDVAKIQYRSALLNAGFEKISQGNWALRAGGKESDEVISTEVENLLKALMNMQAKEFLPLSKIRGAGKNEIILKDAQDKILFTMKWGEDYKAVKQGSTLDLTYVVTSLEKEGMGVDSTAIKAMPGQTLIRTKSAAKPAAESAQLSAPPTATDGSKAAVPPGGTKPPGGG